MFHIPKNKQPAFDNEINGLVWEVILSTEDVEHGCNLFTTKIKSVRERFTFKAQRKHSRKANLPWFSENLWQMKCRDSAWKKS